MDATTNDTVTMADSGRTEDVENALDALTAPEAEAPDEVSSDVQDPELSADDLGLENETDEPEGTPEAEEPEAAEDDTLELSDDELDTVVKLSEDESAPLRDIVEAYKNRDSAEVLEAERQEITAQKEQVEAKLAQFDYVNDEAIPHVFLTKALTKMVEAGTLPKEAYIMIQNGFAELIEQGIYNPDAATAKAEDIAKQTQFEKQQQELEAARREVEVDKQIATIERTHGEVSQEVLTKLVDYIKTEYKRTGELTTLIEAAKANRALFNKPAPSKRSLASKLRSKVTTTAKPAKVTADQAINNFYQ